MSTYVIDSAGNGRLPAYAVAARAQVAARAAVAAGSTRGASNPAPRLPMTIVRAARQDHR